jgi:hypothetical protein
MLLKKNILESVGYLIENIVYRTSIDSWTTQITLYTNLDDRQELSLMIIQKYTLLKALYDAISIMEQEQGKDYEVPSLCLN